MEQSLQIGPKMSEAPPPPPPNLKPPKPRKKRKGLTIKIEEFWEWEKIKGHRSWTCVMNEARRAYLKMQEIEKVIMSIAKTGGGLAVSEESMWKNFKKPNTKSSPQIQDQEKLIAKKEMIRELKRQLKEGIKLTPVDKKEREEYERRKQERLEAIKTGLL